MYNFKQITILSLQKPTTKLIYLLFLLFFTNTILHAACSPFKGIATINEIDQTGSANRFVEIKLLDALFVGDIYKTWTISICNSDNECSGSISYANADAANNPWIVVNHPVVPYRAASNSEPYIDMKNGFDIILKDESGLTIDYLSIENYTAQQDGACTPAYDWQWSRASEGLNNNYNTDNLRRSPDGNGDWGSPGTGNSGGDSEITTNDKDEDGNTAPIITVESISVNEGDNATFTFSLPTGVTKNYEIKIDYNTQGGTAVSPTDYTQTSGTATLAANTNSVTVNVPTTAGSSSGLTYFIFYLSNPVNATIANNYPTGTIIPTTSSATAEWYMDEASWSNSSNEVTDSSANTNHGTPKNNVNTTKNYKVLCSAGSFDGSNDYIEIPHHSSLVGSDKLTYSAWIRPDSWSGSIRQIMSKSVHGGGAGRAQMGIFSENGNFVGRAETAAGRYEVFTPLPPLSARWIHVALTFSGNSLVIYIDGKVAPSVSITKPSIKTFTSTTLVSNTDPLMISKRVGSNQYYFDGYIDEVVVLKEAPPASFIKLMNSNYLAGLNWDGKARSCPGTLHHIEFVHDQSALTCNPETIKVKACANSDCSTLSTSSTTVGLSPTGWVGGDSKTFTGSADYQLKHSTAETVTLSTSSVSPTASNTLVCKTAAGVVIDPCNIIFSDSGFIFKNEIDDTNIIPTQLSGKASNVGYNSKTISLLAVKKSDSDPTQCEAAFKSKTLNIDFAAECINPTSCIAGQLLSLNGANLTATTNNNSVAATSSSYDTRSITFDANGKYNIVLNYPEAGLMELHARHSILLADGSTPSGTFMSGSSSFVVRPLGFSLDVLGQRAADYANNNALDDSTGAHLSYAKDALGSFFKKAGDDFVLTLSAIQWQSADDANNDGIADTTANLTNNTVTKNFGKETTKIIPSNITITSTTILPNAGTISNSANSATFVDGVGTKTISQSEVGVFDFTSTLNNYITTGLTISNKVPSFGRFAPHHFDTLLTHGCSTSTTFTYSGQPFKVIVKARNKANTTTFNYRDDFAYSGVTLSDANPASPALGTFTNNTVTKASFSSNALADNSNFGEGVQTSLTYTFTNKNTPPENIAIRATATNDTFITSSGFSEDTTNIRSGRAKLENVFGSELTPLTVPLTMQYYSDNGTPANLTDDSFVTNTSDSCSTYDAPNGTLANYTDNLSSGEVAVTGTSTVSLGIGNIIFHKPLDTTAGPGVGNEGSVNLLLDNLSSWLTYNWGIDCDNADGDNDTSTGVDSGACSTASFGLYRGDDRIIYWREVFQ